jgi:hypothetical protein
MGVHGCVWQGHALGFSVTCCSLTHIINCPFFALKCIRNNLVQTDTFQSHGIVSMKGNSLENFNAGAVD